MAGGGAVICFVWKELDSANVLRSDVKTSTTDHEIQFNTRSHLGCRISRCVCLFVCLFKLRNITNSYYIHILKQCRPIVKISRYQLANMPSQVQGVKVGGIEHHLLFKKCQSHAD